MSCCAPSTSTSTKCCKPTAETPKQCSTSTPASTQSCCKPTTACGSDTKQKQCNTSSISTPASTQSCCATSASCGNGAALKQRVREDYGRVATVVAQNADEVATRFGYSLEELGSIPEGSNLGVSCGNPLALTNVKEGEVVVDLGSGAGLDCFLAASKVGPSGKVYGIDMTPEMLERARGNAAKRGVTNVEFVKGEIESLPLPDAVADLVISNCVINLVPDKQKAFSEIFRVLKPGGRLAISDIALKKEFPAEVKANVGMFSACFTGAIFFDDISKMLQTAGFEGILVTDAQVDLNAYKELGEGSGCCGSLPASHPLTESLPDIDFNQYAASVKIFALKH